jgi:hypothetical protein
MNDSSPSSRADAKVHLKPCARGVVAPLRSCASRLLAGAIIAAAASAQQPAPSVSGVSGVKQDAVDRVAPVAKDIPPPPNGSHAQAVNKVDGISTIDGVKTPGQTAIPPPPPPSAGNVTSAAGAVGNAGKIQAVTGVGGIDTARLRNLEIAIQMKESAASPAGSGAAKGGKGKAAAAALLSAPIEKAPPKLGPKQDGRDGFQEFEKLQNRGS